MNTLTDLRVSGVFPRHGSVPVRTPSLLPGSGRPRSPALSCGTTSPLRLPPLPAIHSVCSVVRGSPRLISPFRFDLPGDPCISTWMLLAGVILSGSCSGDTDGSHRFPGSPFVPLPCSWTPAGPLVPHHFGTAMLSPLTKQRRLQQQNYFEARSHGFNTSCLRFVPPSRTTTQDSLPVVVSVSGWVWLPTGLLCGVSAFRLPLRF